MELYLDQKRKILHIFKINEQRTKNVMKKKYGKDLDLTYAIIMPIQNASITVELCDFFFQYA